MGVIKSFIGAKLLIKPQGFLDSQMASEIITPIDIQKIESRNIKYISVNFSKIVSANMNAIRFLNDVFEELFKKYNVESAFFSPNKNVFNVLKNLDNIYFHIFENEHIEKIFFDEDYLEEKPIYICCIKDDQNRNMLTYYLIKRGYHPKEIEKEEDGKDGIVIKNSIILKIANKVGAVVKNSIVYFFFDGFLDANLSEMFDIEYFRRNLLIGFKVFVFEMNAVKGMNIHAVRFLKTLGIEAAEYGALLAIVGLDKKSIQPSLIEDLNDMGYIFFQNEDEMFNSKEYEDAINSNEVIYKRSKKITKDFVKLLPYFINSTISTVEMMTGVNAKKEAPKITEVNIDTSKKYVASSIGFYGDMDGMMILILTQNLTKRISKILLGEEFKTKEELNDLVNEFANIIAGTVKREIQKNDLRINITLPKVFDEMDNLKNIVVNRKGVEVKFYFEEEEFYFYLVR